MMFIEASAHFAISLRESATACQMDSYKVSMPKS